jgi:hypothetical protein
MESFKKGYFALQKLSKGYKELSICRTSKVNLDVPRPHRLFRKVENTLKNPNQNSGILSVMKRSRRTGPS